jgi:hypothetical protein
VPTRGHEEGGAIPERGVQVRGPCRGGRGGGGRGGRGGEREGGWGGGGPREAAVPQGTGVGHAARQVSRPAVAAHCGGGGRPEDVFPGILLRHQPHGFVDGAGSGARHAHAADGPGRSHARGRARAAPFCKNTMIRLLASGHWAVLGYMKQCYSQVSVTANRRRPYGTTSITANLVVGLTVHFQRALILCFARLF